MIRNVRRRSVGASPSHDKPRRNSAARSEVSSDRNRRESATHLVNAQCLLVFRAILTIKTGLNPRLDHNEL